MTESRGQTLAPEPFLLAGVIAAIRRILVLTAPASDVFRRSMIESGVLTILTLVISLSPDLLRRGLVAARRV